MRGSWPLKTNPLSRPDPIPASILEEGLYLHEAPDLVHELAPAVRLLRAVKNGAMTSSPMTGGAGSGTGPKWRSSLLLLTELVSKVRNVLLVLTLTIIGSAAIVIAADLVLFAHAILNGCQLVAGAAAGPEERAWWQSRVGPLPQSGTTFNVSLPKPMPGLDGSNRHSMHAPGGFRLPHGLLVIKMKTDSPLLRGEVLVSATTHAWRVRVQLPGGPIVTREYITAAGQPSPNGIFRYWRIRIELLGLTLNSLILAGPLCVLVFTGARLTAGLFRRFRAFIRRVRGQCGECGYTLLPDQTRCPECGHQRKAPKGITSS